MLAFLMFAFGGIELIGMAAAEAQDPEKTIPKAINQVVYSYSDFLYRFTHHSIVISALESVRFRWVR